MSTKQQVHNLIILDESGSMETIKQPVLNGFNEIIQTMKGIEIRFPDQEHHISLISFNGSGLKVLHWKDSVSKITTLNTLAYQPQESTPLYDAMGHGIVKLRNELSDVKKCNVLVTIFTDGEENASKEYSASQIRNLIEQLKCENWTFTYIGTDHNVESMAVSISICNSLNFSRNETSINNMFIKEANSRKLYSEKINANERISENYYSNDAIGKG